jgi:hypothetical protein
MAANSLRDRSASRPGTAQARTLGSVPQPYITPANSILLPDDPVDQEAAQLLEEFMSTHEHGVPESNSDSRDNEWNGLPWWKRPSPLWCVALTSQSTPRALLLTFIIRMLCVIPFSAMAQGATVAPRVELYTMLVCRALKPDIFKDGIFDPVMPTTFLSVAPIPSTIEFLSLKSCASDPTVQATVAQLSAGTQANVASFRR